MLVAGTHSPVASYGLSFETAAAEGVDKGGNEAMTTNSAPVSDVLHSDKHSTLTAEEVAKAVARHNELIPLEKPRMQKQR